MFSMYKLKKIFASGGWSSAPNPAGPPPPTPLGATAPRPPAASPNSACQLILILTCPPPPKKIPAYAPGCSASDPSNLSSTVNTGFVLIIWQCIGYVTYWLDIMLFVWGLMRRNHELKRKFEYGQCRSQEGGGGQL